MQCVIPSSCWLDWDRTHYLAAWVGVEPSSGLGFEAFAACCCGVLSVLAELFSSGADTEVAGALTGLWDFGSVGLFVPSGWPWQSRRWWRFRGLPGKAVGISPLGLLPPAFALPAPLSLARVEPRPVGTSGATTAASHPSVAAAAAAAASTALSDLRWTRRCCWASPMWPKAMCSSSGSAVTSQPPQSCAARACLPSRRCSGSRC